MILGKKQKEKWEVRSREVRRHEKGKKLKTTIKLSKLIKTKDYQGIPTQGSNPGLPHCRQILYCLSHQGGPSGQWGPEVDSGGSSFQPF